MEPEPAATTQTGATPVQHPLLSGRQLAQLLAALFIIPIIKKTSVFSSLLRQASTFVRENGLLNLLTTETDLVFFAYGTLQLVQFWLLLRTLGELRLSRRWLSLCFLMAVVALAFRSLLETVDVDYWPWQVQINPFEPPIWFAAGAALLGWSLFGPDRLLWRLVGTTIASMMLATQWFTSDGRMASADLNFVLTAQLAGVLLLGVVLKVAGLEWKPSTLHVGETLNGEEVSEPSGQFRFVHLIVATTCLAMSLAVLRSIGMATDESWQQVRQWLTDTSNNRGLLTLLIGVGVITSSVGLVLGLLDDLRWRRWLVLSLVVVGMATFANWQTQVHLNRLLVSQVPSLIISIDYSLQPQQWWEWFRVCFTYATIPVVLLSGYRAAGYRWGRRGAPVPSKQS